MQEKASGPSTESCFYCLQKADIWSCGIILYAMLFGKHPFDVDDKLFMRKLVLARYTLPAVGLLLPSFLCSIDYEIGILLGRCL